MPTIAHRIQTKFCRLGQTTIVLNSHTTNSARPCSWDWASKTMTIRYSIDATLECLFQMPFNYVDQSIYMTLKGRLNVIFKKRTTQYLFSFQFPPNQKPISDKDGRCKNLQSQEHTTLSQWAQTILLFIALFWTVIISRWSKYTNQSNSSQKKKKNPPHL